MLTQKVCTTCKVVLNSDDFKFCPHCGRTATVEQIPPKTASEFAGMMYELSQQEADRETAYNDAVKLMVLQLQLLGYTDAMEIFEKMPCY